jgi:hypothetical protein
MSSEPINAPTTVPVPPESRVPPTITAAMTGEKIGLAERISGAVEAAGVEQPGERGHDAAQRHHKAPCVGDANAASARTHCIVTDRMDVRAKAALPS